MKGVSKSVKEDDERRSGSVKSSSLGMPPCTPKKYPRILKHLSLVMPPCIPFSINNHQFVLIHAIFLLLHMLWATLGASRSIIFSLLYFFLLFITSWILAFIVWERNTLHSTVEHKHRLACLSFFLCVCFIFSQLLPC